MMNFPVSQSRGTMPLKQRLLAFVAILLTVMITLLSGIAYWQMRAEIINGVHREIEATLQGNHAFIAHWVAQRRNAIEATAARLASTNDPVPFLIAGKDAGRFDQTFVGYEHKWITYHLADKQPPESYNPTARPWYIEAERTKNTVVSEPYICASTKLPCITVARSVLSQRPSVVGGDVSLKEVIQIVNSIELHGQGYAFLATRDGKIVAHPQPASELKQVDSILPGFDPAILQTTDAPLLPHELEIKGVPKYVAAAPIPGADWVLCIVIDKATALSPLRSLLWRLVLAGLFIVLLGTPIANLTLAMLFAGTRNSPE